MSPLEEDDTFPLWTFGYMYQPEYDDRTKVRVSRGRTSEEAWTCVQRINQSFLEPKKVGVMGVTSLKLKEEYDKGHPYNWLRDPPLWLKSHLERQDLIWKKPQSQATSG